MNIISEEEFANLIDPWDLESGRFDYNISTESIDEYIASLSQQGQSGGSGGSGGTTIVHIKLNGTYTSDQEEQTNLGNVDLNNVPKSVITEQIIPLITQINEILTEYNVNLYITGLNEQSQDSDDTQEPDGEQNEGDGQEP